MKYLLILILFLFQVACNSSGGSLSENGQNEILSDLSTASAICIHASQASCKIWNACYDCRAHRLIRGTLVSGACGTTLFESACRGEVSELTKSNDTSLTYPFINMCVFDELKHQCEVSSANSIDICEGSLVTTLNGCNVRGFSMDCHNQSIWNCQNKNLLLSPTSVAPPQDINVFSE